MSYLITEEQRKNILYLISTAEFKANLATFNDIGRVFNELSTMAPIQDQAESDKKQKK